MAKKEKSRSVGSLTPKIYTGLNDKRMKKGTGGIGLFIKQGETETVQFPEPITKFREYDIHQFQERGGWKYVPCVGDDCPLCEDEETEVSKVHYRFCCNVYDLKTKKVLVLEGPKDLSGRIAMRAKSANKGKVKKFGKFNKKTFDVSKLNTTPVTYDVETSDRKALSPEALEDLKLHDLDEFIKAAVERYYGDKIPAKSKSGRSALDDDDDDDDDYDEDDFDEDELEDMEKSEVRKIAKRMKISLTDKKGEKRSKDKLIRLIIKKQDG